MKVCVTMRHDFWPHVFAGVLRDAHSFIPVCTILGTVLANERVAQALCDTKVCQSTNVCGSVRRQSAYISFLFCPCLNEDAYRSAKNQLYTPPKWSGTQSGTLRKLFFFKTFHQKLVKATSFMLFFCHNIPYLYLVKPHSREEWQDCARSSSSCHSWRHVWAHKVLVTPLKLLRMLRFGDKFPFQDMT